MRLQLGGDGVGGGGRGGFRKPLTERSGILHSLLKVKTTQLDIYIHNDRCQHENSLPGGFTFVETENLVPSLNVNFLSHLTTFNTKIIAK